MSISSLSRPVATLVTALCTITVAACDRDSAPPPDWMALVQRAAPPEVVLIDFQEGSGRVYVGVHRESEVPRVRATLEGRGIPRDRLVVGVEPKISVGPARLPSATRRQVPPR